MESGERPSSAMPGRSAVPSLLHRHMASTAEAEPALHHHTLPPQPTRLHRLLRRRRYRNHRTDCSGCGRTGRLDCRGCFHRRRRLLGDLGHFLDFLLGLLDIIDYRSLLLFQQRTGIVVLQNGDLRHFGMRFQPVWRELLTHQPEGLLLA